MVVTSGGASWADLVSLPIKATAAAEDSVASRLRRVWVSDIMGLPIARAFARRVLPLARSGLQLAFELVEETPIRGVGDDLVGARFDHAHLAQPQGKEPDCVFRVVVTPLVVRNVVQGLERIIVIDREPAIDNALRHHHAS